MKILYVIHDNKQGGAAISFLELISEMKKTNEVFVLTPHKRGFVPDQLEQMGIRHRNAHYFWWFVKLSNNRWFAQCKKTIYWLAVKFGWLEAKRLSIILKKEKIDIVHTNSSVINFGGLLARNLNKPHIWHIREFAQEDFGLVPVMNFAKICSFINNYSSSVIAISKAIQIRYSKYIRPEKITMIYNGVNDKYQINREFDDINGDNQTVNFLISGKICKEKGQEDVIFACNELVKRGDNNFHLSIAGDGDSKYLQELIADFGIQSHITILGKISDMLGLRKKMDVEIVASKCEAFGRVTIEAMKMSMPVIGTNTGGTPELIEEGDTGWLFQYSDYISLSQQMQKFIDNPKILQEMGMKAYNSTLGKFTSKENAQNILKLYEGIVKQSVL